MACGAAARAMLHLWTLLLSAAWAAADTDSKAQPSIADLLLNSPGKWPEMTKGKGKGTYEWVLNQRGLRQGVTHLGPNDRLRLAVNKLISGQNTTVVAIGGSITSGQGAVDAPNYPQWLQQHLTDEYGPNVYVQNGAVGGTMSSYMSVCLNMHVPRHADIVFVEYNQNDHATSTPIFGNMQRKQFERLLRKILSLPNHPAVVLMNSYSWTMPAVPPGIFWNSAEREYFEFATYYSLPMLSIKGCCYHLMAAGVSGFNITRPRNQDMDALKNVAFLYDSIHPDGRTGFRIMAELAMHLIQSTAVGLATEPLAAIDRDAAGAPLPPPMITNNYQSKNDTCFIGNHFTRIVTKQEGFEWINESQGIRSKWGMVAKLAGSVLEMTVNTEASARHMNGDEQQVAPQGADKEDMVNVELAFLASYEHMGRANITCVSGCECEPVLMEAHTTHRTSQLHLITFQVTQSPMCVIQVKVRDDSGSGQHKIKVSGLIVSEEAGRAVESVRNHMAVEYVHDISFQSTSSTFDMRNHVRRLLRWAVSGPAPGLQGIQGSQGGGGPPIAQQLDSLSTEQLESLLQDEEAFKQFMIKHVSEAQASKALQDIAARNRSLAQENLDMQADIEEARNHVAVVKSSEFTGARSGFAELQARQAAVIEQMGSRALTALLCRDVDQLDAKSGALQDALLAGTLAPDHFVEQYLAQRTVFHVLDIKRQVGEFSLS